MSRASGAICEPDLHARPHQLVVVREVALAAPLIYAAWTRGWHLWFAAPGSVLMRPEVNTPFFFETVHRPEGAAEAQRHPHYGRFLRLVPDRLVELTWVTGAGGTEGAETIVTLELQPQGGFTHLRLTHAGFMTTAARDRHAGAWPMVLEHMENALREQGHRLDV